MLKLLWPFLLFTSPVQEPLPDFCQPVFYEDGTIDRITCRVQRSDVISTDQLDTLANTITAIARDGTNLQQYDAHFMLQEMIHKFTHLKRYNYKWGTLPQSIVDNAEFDNATQFLRRLSALLKPKTLLQLLHELSLKEGL